jgi:hypothetical protein
MCLYPESPVGFPYNHIPTACGGGGSFRQAELLFAGMADDEFAGFVAGLGVVLDRIRAELARTKRVHP